MADFTGTGGNDVLVGTDGNDNLYGLGGADFLKGLFGDDYIDGGAGNDRATYYLTNPAFGGVTVSLMLQGQPQDTGAQGWDTLVNIENLSGTPFSDTLTGDNGDNWLWGSPATLGDVSVSKRTAERRQRQALLRTSVTWCHRPRHPEPAGKADELERLTAQRDR